MADREEQNKIIKDICKEFNCTQIELAEMVGVTQGAIKKWSDGTREIPKYFLKEIITPAKPVKRKAINFKPTTS